jgi:hypothetical protein
MHDSVYVFGRKARTFRWGVGWVGENRGGWSKRLAFHGYRGCANPLAKTPWLGVRAMC